LDGRPLRHSVETLYAVSMNFGDPIVSASIIAKRIADCIALDETIYKDGIFTKKNSAWTKVVRKELRLLGDEHHCQTRHELGENGTEKLYDVIWLGEDRLMRLAAEVEWNLAPEAIAYDFEKLLYAKAPMKLMIHSRQNQAKVVLPLLQRILAEYGGHVGGEEYVVLQLSDSKNPKRTHGVSFRVPPTTSGRLCEGDVRFLAVDESPFAWAYL
jgi:hypothetical protein